MIAVAGVRTTNGEVRYQDFVPERDAAAVHRLRGAGAVILGKTNTPPNGADVVTHNDVFGVTRNPWDLSRTPGGSSGGSAAAVAAALTALDLGGDIGGSLRLPAHFCGVFSHKPSFGIVPQEGTMPSEQRHRVDMAVLGPLARSAGDLALALKVITGPTTPDDRAWKLELPPPRQSSLADYRLAVWLDDPACPTGREVRAILDQTVTNLAAAGATVISAAPPVDLASAHDLYFQVLNGQVADSLPIRRTLLALRPLLPSRSYPLRRVRYVTAPHWEWLEAANARAHLRDQWHAFFKNVDAVLCPVAPVPALPLDDRPIHRRSLTIDGQRQRGVEGYLKLTAWNSLASAAYLPASVAPVGISQTGLPVGIQIITDYLDDRTAIDIAACLEEIGVAKFISPDAPRKTS
jgi:amidase